MASTVMENGIYHKRLCSGYNEENDMVVITDGATYKALHKDNFPAALGKKSSPTNRAQREAISS